MAASEKIQSFCISSPISHRSEHWFYGDQKHDGMPRLLGLCSCWNQPDTSPGPKGGEQFALFRWGSQVRIQPLNLGEKDAAVRVSIDNTTRFPMTCCRVLIPLVGRSCYWGVRTKMGSMAQWNLGFLHGLFWATAPIRGGASCELLDRQGLF